MGGGMNCGYLCGMVGILKLVSVVLTVIPTGLVFHATQNATYYKDEKWEKGCTEGSALFDGLANLLNQEKSAPCPLTWLGITSLGVFFVCFIVSLVCLIVLLLVKLNENGIFKQVDYIYHLIGGAALIIVGTFPIAFGALAILKFKCDQDNETAQQICSSYRKDVLEPELHIAAGVIAVIGGIVYIFIALKVKKD